MFNRFLKWLEFGWFWVIFVLGSLTVGIIFHHPVAYPVFCISFMGIIFLLTRGQEIAWEKIKMKFSKQ